MNARPETCPCCGKFTTQGREQLAVQGWQRPIYGTDFSQPLSVVVKRLRDDLTRVRGQLSDIGFGYTGWREHVAPVEGLLTCGLVALYDVEQQMAEHEKR